METLRPDLQVIANLIPDGSSILDVGCASGELLYWLQKNRNVQGRGLERDVASVRECVRKGLAVIQGYARQDLPYYPDDTCDYVVLSRTLQVMDEPLTILNHLVRIGRQAIVSIPNFAHWKNRLYLVGLGRMPVTSALSYQWYDTPNIHFCSLRDFIVLCREQEITINKQLFINAKGTEKRIQRTGLSYANLFAEQGIFVISRHL